MDKGLEGRISRLEVIDIFLVDAFAAVVGVGVVDTFGVVYSGAGGAGRRRAVALHSHERDMLAKSLTRV